MNPTLKYPDRPTASAAELGQDVARLVTQLGDGATALLVIGYDLASGTNKIRHGLGQTPRSAGFVPYSNVGWWSPTRPDGEFVYIDTAGAVTGDLQIWV